MAVLGAKWGFCRWADKLETPRPCARRSGIGRFIPQPLIHESNRLLPQRPATGLPSDVQAKHANGISPGQLRNGALVDALKSRDVTDRIVLGHIEGVIGAHKDTVRSEQLEQISQLVIAEHDGVEINLSQIGSWWQREAGVAILPGAPGVIDPAGIAGKVTAPMYSHELLFRKSGPRSREY